MRFYPHIVDINYTVDDMLCFCAYVAEKPIKSGKNPFAFL